MNLPARLDDELLGLPPYPASRADYERWSAWGDAQYLARRVPALRVDHHQLEPEERARLHVAWRALIGRWADKRSVAPDDAPLIMHHFLLCAQQAPPFVLLAAQRLARACLESGATSTDALFLIAAFAWPLRDVDPELGDIAWSYMIHAPWQTDPLSQRDLILAVHHNEAWHDGRGLVDLARARQEAGLMASARAFLEAVALVQARQEQLDGLTSYRDFVSFEIVPCAHDALEMLAQLYVEGGEDQVYAREVLKRVAELTRSAQLITYIERRVWDRPLDELYAWSERLEHPRQLDDELEVALTSGQPHHARRLVEAVMVRKFNRPWYGSAIENLPVALERFERQLERFPPSDPLARRAAEHLATLYVRTHHVTHHARSFVHGVARSIAFTGEGAELHPIKGELERFFNRSDPYHVLRHEAALLMTRQSALSDDERAASDEVERWFSERFRPGHHRGAIDRLARLIASPITDAARLATSLPYVEEVCLRVFRLVVERGPQLAGDLDAITRHAALIRSQYGHGLKLIDYARSVVAPEVIGASLLATTSSFLPPGLSLAAHTSDLGSSLLLAFRAVARIGAVFGRALRSESGLQLVADSFAVGLSSRDGEGLLTYLSRDNEQLTTALTLGGVMYGGSRLVEHLWVAPRAEGVRPSEQLVRHLARVCGFELQHTAITRIIPVVGALISGVSTYAFMKMITEAAIHVAARDALMVRVHSYEQI